MTSTEAPLPASSQQLLATVQVLNDRNLPESDRRDLNQLADQLRRGDLPPDTRQSYEERLTIAIHYVQDSIEGGYGSDRPKLTDSSPTLTPGPTPTPVYGIRDSLVSPDYAMFGTNACPALIYGLLVLVACGVSDIANLHDS
jgi:hypothetical protein